MNQWHTAPSGQWVLTPSPPGTCPSQGCRKQDFLFKSKTRVAHCQPHLVTSLPDLFLSLSQVRGLVWEGSQVSQALLQTQRSQGGPDGAGRTHRCPLPSSEGVTESFPLPVLGPQSSNMCAHTCMHTHAHIRPSPTIITLQQPQYN